VNTIPESLLAPGRARRRYSKEFKAELVAQCRGLGVSMARVSMAHCIKANLLRRQVAEASCQALAPTLSGTRTTDSASLPTLECQVTRTSAAFVAAKLPAAPRSDLQSLVRQ